MRHDREASSLASAILSIMKDERQIFDEKDRSAQTRKQERVYSSENKRSSVLGNLHQKQNLVSEGQQNIEKQKVGQKEWQI